MMKVLVVNGGYRKGKTIDAIVEKLIEGVKQNPDISVESIRLIEKDIKYCTNCMVCRNDDPSKEVAVCPIDDDMKEIYQSIQDADAFVFASPINMGTVTAVMKTFLERTCWTLAKPGTKPIKGCPEPRTTKKKKAVVILSSGVVPPILRTFCDDATSLIKGCCQCSFGAKVIGSIYAGAVEKKGLDHYSQKAYELGKRLAKV
jgi:multimeric flavodoxin WrbA